MLLLFDVDVIFALSIYSHHVLIIISEPLCNPTSLSKNNLNLDKFIFSISFEDKEFVDFKSEIDLIFNLLENFVAELLFISTFEKW